MPPNRQRRRTTTARPSCRRRRHRRRRRCRRRAQKGGNAPTMAAKIAEKVVRKLIPSTETRRDEYDQDGKGLMLEMAHGGLQGLKRTRNPLKAPSNTLQGLKAGLARGVKRKAEQVIKKKINKRAKKALSKRTSSKPCGWPVPCFHKQTKKARDIFGV